MSSFASSGSGKSVDLWHPSRIAQELREGAIHRALSAKARDALGSPSDLERRVAGALSHPKPLDISLPVFNAVLAAQYLALFEALDLPRALAVYEPCAGGSDPVMLAAECYSEGQAVYATVNLNRKLREELLEKAAHLRSSVRVIEDDAANAATLLSAQRWDVACFHHAINDILQTAVAEPRGMRTAGIDWFQNERQMIEWLAEDAGAGLLEKRGRPELLQIVTEAIRLLGPGGYLIFDHWNWQKFVGVEWFPWELFYNLIPLARSWIATSGLPAAEIQIPGVNSQWWMILRKHL